MRVIKPKIECLLVALAVLTLAVGMTSAATGRLNNMSVITQRSPTGAANMQVATPDLGPAKLQPVPSGEVIVRLGKLPQGGRPGDPMLPYALVRVLVPPDADLATVKANLSSRVWEELPGKHEIAPAPPAAHTGAGNPVISWGSKNASIIKNGRDSTIYNTNAYFPTEAVQIVSVGQFRQWKLVEFKVWMAAYNPVEKKVRILKNPATTLSIQRLPTNLAVGLSSSTPPVLPGAAKSASQLLTEVDNPQDLETFYGSSAGAGSSGGAPGLVSADYVIITTSTIVANSTKLAAFITDKQSQGYTVKTVVEAAAADDTHYVTGATCDARANNIRSWLQNHYLGDGTEYVLLIGNPHPSTFSNATSVPMKNCSPRSGQGSDEDAPSDMFFAELSNTWNLDGDGKYGEFNGDYGAGGCDKFCEVKVGRIPVYDANYVNLDAILQKCIDYRNAGGDLSWRAKVLIPAAVSNWQPQDDSPYDNIDDYSWGDTFGDDWGQDIKSNASWAGFSIYTLYEKSGVYGGGTSYPLTACNAALTNANVKVEWPNKYGFVTWWGHGNQTAAYRRTWNNDNYGGGADNWTQCPAETSDTVFFQSADCAVLDNNCPSFVVQVSCDNGYPENSGNLGYSLLKKGAIGTISGTRVTWYAIGSWNTGLGGSYGDNASYGYYMFDEMGVNNRDIGTAFVNCKSSFGTNWVDGASWMNMVDLSLYGDPSLSLSIQMTVTKWLQPPDQTPYGIDLRCDRSDGVLRVLADDFNCATTGPITKVTIWGSWFKDKKGKIKKIHLSIHKDNPMGPHGWSEPNDLLWQGDFNTPDFNETLYYTAPGTSQREWFWDPVANKPPPTQFADANIWEYDISIDPNKAFIQQGGPSHPVVYWLDAYVELEPNTLDPNFGWKSAPEELRWQDDAVCATDPNKSWQALIYPPQHPYYGTSIDLAFAVFTTEVPQPPKPPIPHLKWSQPPIEIDPNSKMPTYSGWDVPSLKEELPTAPIPIWNIVADDFRCLGSMPITSIHWWGSYYGWEQPGGIPPALPIAWKICFWSNVPAGAVGPGFSYPKQLLWQIDVPANRVEVNEVGTDNYQGYYPNDVCYQYTLYLEPNECFQQGKFEPNTIDNVFWISIAALYPPGSYPEFPWGWKTRPWSWMDDAIRFSVPDPLQTGMILDPTNNYMTPIKDPIYQDSFDVAFELDTDPNYIKWEQAYTGIRNWPHYEDQMSMATMETVTEQVTKWLQKPDTGPNGVDVDAYTDIWQPQILADDFLCNATGKITDIHIWGSWYHDHPPNGDLTQVTFTLSLHENLPVGDPNNPNQWSMPGKVLWTKTFGPGAFQVVQYAQLQEGWFIPCSQPQYYYPLADTICYLYSFIITPTQAFTQTLGKIYWLDVQAIPSQDTTGYPDAIRFGWKDSQYHPLIPPDNAVWATGSEPIGVPGPWQPLWYPPGHPYAGSKIDLAFEITTNTGPPIKYIQEPDLQPPFSIDIDATKDKVWQPQVLADDFNCVSTDPITDIHIWGSWYHNMIPKGDPRIVIFKLSIHANIPTGPNGYSIPGAVLWQREFQPGEFTASSYSQGLEGYFVPCSDPCYYEPNADSTCWQYDFLIDPCEAFIQLGTPSHPVIYWLSVQARPLSPPQGEPIEPMRQRFGWKTRDLNDGHFMDAAVWSKNSGVTWNKLVYPIGHPYQRQSADLAFEITSQKTHQEFVIHRRVADDWKCERKTPVTSLAWWGSYLGYQFEPFGPFMPLPVKPDYFELTIWGDVPVDPCTPGSFSHPNDVIWDYKAYNYDEVLVGYDKYPEGAPQEPVFRYSVRIPDPNDWFRQKDVNNIYWLSVMAVYDVNSPNYDWGWTNHKLFFNDDAVAGYLDPTGAWVWGPLYDQTGAPADADMSFILFTEPGCFPCCHKDYFEWLKVGKPACWCYLRQCHGDSDNATEFIKGKGNYYVHFKDLDLLMANWNRLDPNSSWHEPNICADFVHNTEFVKGKGYYRVHYKDLDVLMAYWNVLQPPQGPGIDPNCLNCP